MEIQSLTDGFLEFQAAKKIKLLVFPKSKSHICNFPNFTCKNF